MKEYAPRIHSRIKELDWDMSIFAQHYITIFQIFTPSELAGIVIDLFVLEG